MTGSDRSLDASSKRIGRPSNEEAAAIEDRILASAWSLMLDDGNRGLSIERIAQDAGVSKKTIYTRFCDNVHLLHTLVKRRIALEGIEARNNAKTGSFHHAFCNVGEQIISFLTSEERQALARALLSLPDARHDACKATYEVGLGAIDALLEHPDAASSVGHLEFSTFREALLQCLIGYS